MTYELRPGVICTKVCDTYLLIPNREASEHCVGVQRVGLIAAAAVENIEKRQPVENIYKIYSILSKKPDDEVHEKIDGMLEDLCEKGYLIRVD